MTAYVAEVSERTRFRREPELSGTLPASYYFDPEIFEREKEEIWFKTWQFVGYTFDLKEAGDYITADILDQKIFVVCGKDGELRAFFNVCMHRGHVLVEGKGNRTIFTCPFHAWSYDSEGTLKAAGNAENVAGFRHQDFGLSEVRVETLLGFLVFVNLDASAETLASQVDGLEAQVHETVQNFERMIFARRDRFDINANWKFIFDQLECYHCPVVHPEATDRRLVVAAPLGIRHLAKAQSAAPQRCASRQPRSRLRRSSRRSAKRIQHLVHLAQSVAHLPLGRQQFQGHGRSTGRYR